MSTSLVAHTGEFDQRQVEIMRRTVAAGVSAEEFALFLEVCKHRRLNPMNREIYAISRYDYNTNSTKMTIQVSIDGLRLLAERSGKYKGQLGPFWCDESGEWQEVWLKKAPPAAAKVGILRSDFSQPIWAIARYDSYVQTKKDGKPTAMWEKMSDVLLAKCAESLGFRKAFPGEVAGLYTHEEMSQADHIERNLPEVMLEQETTVEGEVVDVPLSQPKQHSTALTRMIEQAQARTINLGKSWEETKTEALGKSIADAELVMKDFQYINGLLKRYEQEQTAA